MHVSREYTWPLKLIPKLREFPLKYKRVEGKEIIIYKCIYLIENKFKAHIYGIERYIKNLITVKY